MDSLFSRLLRMSKKSPDIIRKGKKYVKPGQKPPKGVVLHRGKRGGTYYIVEDKPQIHEKNNQPKRTLANPFTPKGNIDLLTEEQLRAIINYTGEGGAESNDINWALREYKGDIDRIRIKFPAIAEKIKVLDSALKITWLRRGKLYRGIKGVERKIYENLNIGETYDERGFLSTTMNENWSKFHFFTGFTTDKCILHIEYPDGTHGISKGLNDREQEVIFERNTILQKQDHQVEGALIIITVRVLQ